jgi:hypothetical protein
VGVLLEGRVAQDGGQRGGMGSRASDITRQFTLQRPSNL